MAALAAALAVAAPAFALTPANGDFEAESGMTTSSTNIKAVSDGAASGGRALEFYVNGTATRTTTVPAASTLTVYARETDCSGAPVLTVAVDGAQVLSATVATTGYAAYAATTQVAAGSRAIRLGFANDFSSASCDRNLIVDRVEFTPTGGGGGGGGGTSCDGSASPPTSSDPGTTVIADNFESGDFSRWTRVTQEGDATAKVQTSVVHAGRCAALIHVTAHSGSRANLSKSLPSGKREVWATGYFDITRQGADTSSNVPTFRFFNGSTRLLDVSRQNGSGVFFVRWPSGSGSSWNSTGRTLAIGRWYQIKVHAYANAAQSRVTVWLDGAQVFDRSSSATGFASFAGATTITSVLVGAEHVVQDGDFAADDVVVKVV